MMREFTSMNGVAALAEERVEGCRKRAIAHGVTTAVFRSLEKGTRRGQTVGIGR